MMNQALDLFPGAEGVLKTYATEIRDTAQGILQRAGLQVGPVMVVDEGCGGGEIGDIDVVMATDSRQKTPPLDPLVRGEGLSSIVVERKSVALAIALLEDPAEPSVSDNLLVLRNLPPWA